MARNKATPTKPVIFISYIHEEEYLAEALQEKISTLLLGGVEFFAAGLPSSVQPGWRWLEQIDKALKNANAVIILCSANSMNRPWINFETGAAWMSLTFGSCSNVIPLCHGGLRPSKLIEPLRSLQALDITSDRDIKRLVSVLAKVGNLDVPKFDAKKFIADLPPSGQELETQQRVLHETLELTSSTLRGKANTKSIQAVVTSIVKVWSQALYHNNEPPAPIGIPPLPPGSEFPCRLCDDDHAPTANGCCSNCGLFCTLWLRDMK